MHDKEAGVNLVVAVYVQQRYYMDVLSSSLEAMVQADSESIHESADRGTSSKFNLRGHLRTCLL